MFKLIYRKYGDRLHIKDDLLSGLTVALALVPEAVAFAFVAGVDPIIGLNAAFVVGLMAAIFGGRPGMISGATGAMAVVIVALVAEHSLDYMYAAVILAGILQVLAGICRLGKFIRLVPHPVMFGFVNGLAIVIFLAQLTQFQEKNAEGIMEWMSGTPLYWMLGLVAITMAISHFLPLLTKAVPSSLVAIVVVSLAVIGLEIDTVTVGQVAGEGGLGGSFPAFYIPTVPLTWETLSIIFPYSLTLAGVGLIESLMTLSLIDELTETRGRGNRECVGQGVANISSGILSGMGGCAMIGQSMINIRSGGRGRLSGISAALFLLTFIMFASSLIEQIPVAALVGVMFMVVIATFEWSSFRILHKIPRMDAFVLVLVSLITVFMHNLALAVIAGVIASALSYAWQSSKQIRVSISKDEQGSKHYDLHGQLFFGSVQSFHDLFAPADDPEDIIIDFAGARVWDHSAVEAINTLTERYSKIGKKLHLRHLSPDCRLLLKKSESMIEVNILEDPQYHVADDELA